MICHQDSLQQLLVKSESRYRRLFETAQDGILLLNAMTGQVEDVNPYLVKMLGYSYSEIVDKKLWDLGNIVDVALSKKMFAELQTNGHVRYEDMPLRTKSGKCIDVEFVSNTYDCDNLKVIQCNIRDISDRKRLEKNLHKEEARYKTVVATASDGIVTINSAGRIIDWNQSAERIFGYSAKEAIGRPVTLLIPSRFHDHHRRGMKRVLTGGGRHLNGKVAEMTGRRKDTQEVPLEMSLAEWNDENHSYFTGIIRDITNRKMIEREMQVKTLELTKANIELEQFAYVASHDLREPLRMVNSFLTLLERRNPDLDVESKEFLAFAKDGAVRMDGLVLALLELSRIGRINCEFGVIPSADAVAEAISNLQVQIQESNCSVEVMDTMPMVTGNHDELVRLFQNLVANAIKYRHPDRQPVIRVNCDHCPDGWQFAVEDNGIGIAHEYFERIFWIFQRLHTREKYEGTGIGLAICKKIVEFHGGHIWVESDPGQGSIFRFTIPEAGETEPTVPEMERAADGKVNEIMKAPTRPHRKGPQT